MSKLSFRARALDASKPLPIYMSEELPDLPEYSAINRAVPQMPSGMEKEEECEHHLQRAIVTGLIIPTPEVSKVEDVATYDRLYPPTYRPPRQLIRMQPFAMEEDYPDYDIDSEDEKWITMQKLDISPRKFEEMMDRLEKNCAQNFAAQDRKELLLKDDDELSIAVYDYWLSKRLRTPQSLVPCVKTEANNRSGGSGSGGSGGGNNNPYLAFRRRTEKMQTRKNRKNDEASYEKMVKLKRDLTTALTLLELVKRRETTKRQLLYATIQIYEKRYQANDLSGSLLAEVSALKSVRPFTPLYSNQYTTPNHSAWSIKPPKVNLHEEVGIGRKEKRQYKKRKHKASNLGGSSASGVGGGGASSPDEDSASPPSPSSQIAFPFLRNKNCSYQAPLSGGKIGDWDWRNDDRLRYSLTSLGPPSRRCIGLVRRRIGRGGRVILDRAGPSMDDLWASLDFTIHDNASATSQPLRHFRPQSPTEVESPRGEVSSSWLSLEIEGRGGEMTPVDLDLGELFPQTEALAVRREVLGWRENEEEERPQEKERAPQAEQQSSRQRRPASLLERWVLETGGSSSSRRRSPPPPPPPPNPAERLRPPEGVLPPRFPASASEFSVTDAPKPSSNGPLSNDHSSSWLVSNSPASGIVCKRSGSTSSALLNSKLSGRANSNGSEDSNSNAGGSEETSSSGGGIRRGVALLHTHPMEVT